jgi:hypothetical protein
MVKESVVIIGIKSLVILYCVSFIYRFFQGQEYFFIDNVNLVFHEAGHFIFFFTPPIISILAGTFMQLFFPLFWTGYFYFIKQAYFSSLVCFFWYGENLINVGKYMEDASVQLLPLLGGGIHDWEYIFSQLHVINSAEVIGKFTQAIGLVVMAAGIIGMIFVLVCSLYNSDYVRNNTYKCR